MEKDKLQPQFFGGKGFLIELESIRHQMSPSIEKVKSR
jgi:hypothetical protein